MNLRRVIGYFFIITATAGLIFCIVGVFEVWHYRPIVTGTVIENLALFDQTLSTTQDSLSMVGQVVQVASDDIASLQTTTQALAQAIQSTNPILDSLISLTSKNIPATVAATQTSLVSAQASALFIDNALTTISSVPFLSLGSYQPKVPLHTALAQVSTSLNSVTPTLATISTSLADGKTDLGVVESELTKISETTVGISSTLGSAQTAIDQYKVATAQLKANVEATQRGAAAWITTLAWILSFVLGLLLIAQMGLGAQGLDMLRAPNKTSL